jgi:hypothetical protein
MARSKGATSSNKKKATARGRAAQKSAGGNRTPASTKRMSHGRFRGERPLTGEDRPAGRKGGKAQGTSAKPRGRGGVLDTIGDPDRTPDIGMAQPSPVGRHNI